MILEGNFEVGEVGEGRDLWFKKLDGGVPDPQIVLVSIEIWDLGVPTCESCELDVAKRGKFLSILLHIGS